jgi:predicted outer membrane lipoprotein
MDEEPNDWILLLLGVSAFGVLIALWLTVY